MSLQHYLLDHVVVIDDGKIRVVVDVSNKQVRLFSHYINDKGNEKLRTERVLEFDVSNKQVRLFSHYINDKGNEKLRTERVLEFDAFLNMLYAMYLQGTPK